jgi:hypothetical protein
MPLDNGYPEGSHPWIGAKNVFVKDETGLESHGGNKYTDNIKLVLPEDIEVIPGYQFSRLKQLRSVTLNSTVTQIGEYAFIGSGLRTMVIPDSVTRIERAAFNGCSDLAWIVVGKNVEFAGQGAFDGANLNGVLFFNGTSDNFHITSSGYPGALSYLTVYYLSEQEPLSAGNYWHYVDGVPTAW